MIIFLLVFLLCFCSGIKTINGKFKAYKYNDTRINSKKDTFSFHSDKFEH